MAHDDSWLTPPDACARWCHAHAHGLAYELTVPGDEVEVDIDWWNTYLTRLEIPVTLLGQTLDQEIVGSGTAIVTRGDLRLGSPLVESPMHEVGLLYLCAAWLQAHPDREVEHRFVDARNRARDQKDRFNLMRRALRSYCDSPRSFDQWVQAPGAGVAVTAAFLWAVDDRRGHRCQLIDKQGVAQLIFEGWGQINDTNQFTRNRYNRYVDLLWSWADRIGAPAELVEMWLIHRWRERTDPAAQEGRTPPLDRRA